MKRAQTAGVALVGMAGRFPGAGNPRELWQNLIEGREGVVFASREELIAAGVRPDLIDNPDYVPASSTIRDPDHFDAGFFGFSAREAEIIDPQQRVFLECAWEAIEDAGCNVAEYEGAVGVFAGVGMNGYIVNNLLTRPEILASVGFYQAMVANDKDFLCSRVAYKLNLRGPAVTVQAACSTSLVAVEMAFESVLRGECDMALAGGVSIQLPQPLGYQYIPGMILSRDGHCRAFDAAACGTVPGAGAGVVVLKRLQDAIDDGDHIYAVIRGAAINNDGAAKVGYSAPSVQGQQVVIRKSMEMAGFDPASVRYVETHGTGTEVGDPIEFTALTKAFEAAAQNTESCALGALKTNIGHLDAAAGVAGFIKASLAIKHRLIPPTLHFTNPNPLIDFGKSPFYVNSTPVPYHGKEPFRAGVNSFGIGGTNAHVSLEEAPATSSDPVQHSQLIVLSAKTANALDRRTSQLLEYLEQTPDANLGDVAFTLQAGRQRFPHRQVLVAQNADHLKAQLANPQSAELRKLRAEAPLADTPQIAFLFPGQGAQYINMGRDLYESVPLFRELVDHCAETLQPHLGLDLRSVLYPKVGEEKQAEHLLGQTSITQPAIFTIEYAIARLWLQCGISPAAMIGHSVGEYVAACLAGVFSLEEALVLIAERGKLIQAMPSGVMLAVSLSEHDLAPLLYPALSIAAVNFDNQTVASGPEESIQQLEDVLNKKKIVCRRLKTSHAFHSPMMDAIVEPFVERVRKVTLHAPSLRYLSNVSGTWITAAQATDPAYWGAHLRNAVRFADCARSLLRDSDYVLLEVGPGETLGSLVRAQAGPHAQKAIVSSMRHALAPANDRDHWLAAIGKLWLKNVRIDWKAMHAGDRRLRVSLPTYPFERQRYWIEPAKAAPLPASESVTLLKKPDIADWFYIPSWKKTLTGSVEKGGGRSDNWLVFTEDDAFSREVVARLSAQGAVVEVEAARAFQAAPNRYEVCPDSREDYRALLRERMTRHLWPERIVYLWKPKAPDCGIPAAMALMQTLEEENPGAPIEFNVIVDRAYSVLNERISSPAHAARNAFWRVATLEYPNIRSRILDIDLSSDQSSAADQLITELQRRASNETIAYRGSSRWKQIYEPVRIEHPDTSTSDSSVALRDCGTYVITGGAGGIGLVLARHIASKARSRIVLISRTPLPPEAEWPALMASPGTPKDVKEKIRGIQAILDVGGKPVVMQGDVSDAAAMKNVMTDIRNRYGAVHGIVHAAGVAGSGMIQTKTKEDVHSVLSPKVQGTEWLREQLRAADLDFIMLYSSVSAILPYFGLSDYAAANAYLDGFAAAHDDPAGTRVLSVNWDAWREVGMAAHAEVPAALAHLRDDRLKHAILPEEGAEIFDRILAHGVTQFMVSTRDVAGLQRLEAAAVANAAPVSSLPLHEDGKSRPEPKEELLPGAEDEIESFIIGLWRELLGVNTVAPHDNFFQLGGHSLMGTQILSRVRERFRINLPLRSVFEAATPAELAERVRVMRWAVNPGVASAEVEREEIEI